MINLSVFVFLGEEDLNEEGHPPGRLGTLSGLRDAMTVIRVPANA
jgi:hypothetical protein